MACISMEVYCSCSCAPAKLAKQLLFSAAYVRLSVCQYVYLSVSVCAKLGNYSSLCGTVNHRTDNVVVVAVVKALLSCFCCCCCYCYY